MKNWMRKEIVFFFFFYSVTESCRKELPWDWREGSAIRALGLAQDLDLDPSTFRVTQRCL